MEGQLKRLQTTYERRVQVGLLTDDCYGSKTHTEHKTSIDSRGNWVGLCCGMAYFPFFKIKKGNLTQMRNEKESNLNYHLIFPIVHVTFAFYTLCVADLNRLLNTRSFRSFCKRKSVHSLKCWPHK